MSELLTMAQAAKAIGCSRQAVWMMVQRDTLPAIVVDGHWKIRAADVRKLMSDRKKISR